MKWSLISIRYVAMTYVNNEVHMCVVKRPAAYGRGSFLLLDKIDEICYTIDVVEYLDVRAKYAYAFLRVN